MARNSDSKRAGFTLIEILAVVVIMALLAGGVFMLMGVGDTRSKIAETNAQIQALSSLLEEYKNEYGDYPTVTNTATPARSAATRPVRTVSLLAWWPSFSPWLRPSTRSAPTPTWRVTTSSAIATLPAKAPMLGNVNSVRRARIGRMSWPVRTVIVAWINSTASGGAWSRMASSLREFPSAPIAAPQ